jgi:hypothetical protein
MLCHIELALRRSALCPLPPLRARPSPQWGSGTKRRDFAVFVSATTSSPPPRPRCHVRATAGRQDRYRRSVDIDWHRFDRLGLNPPRVILRSLSGSLVRSRASPLRPRPMQEQSPSGIGHRRRPVREQTRAAFRRSRRGRGYPQPGARHPLKRRPVLELGGRVPSS